MTATKSIETNLRTPSGQKSKIRVNLTGSSVDMIFYRSSEGELWVRLTREQATRFARDILEVCAALSPETDGGQDG